MPSTSKIVKYDEPSEASSVEIARLLPAGYLSSKATYIDPYRDKHEARALIGIQFGVPWTDCRGFCSPDDGLTLKPSVFDKGLLEGYDVSGDHITLADLASATKSVVKDELGFPGIIAFDFMREDPPQGLLRFLRAGISAYTVFLKRPTTDWPEVISSSIPNPYSSLQMRMNVAAYAISNPDLFLIRRVVEQKLT